MNCPSCANPNYYFGLNGHDCPNPTCLLPGKKSEVGTKEDGFQSLSFPKKGLIRLSISEITGRISLVVSTVGVLPIYRLGREDSMVLDEVQCLSLSRVSILPVWSNTSCTILRSFRYPSSRGIVVEDSLKLSFSSHKDVATIRFTD